MLVQIVFKKIPKLAKIFYTIGFSILIVALILFFNFKNLLSLVQIQQAFIGGAIIVAIGSVINTLYQFKKPKKTLKE